MTTSRLLCPGVLATALIATTLIACSRGPAGVADADYAGLGLRPACAPGMRPGMSETSGDLRTSGGLHFNVRTPRNYDPALAHPLLVVYAPAGYTRRGSERYAGLTGAATAAGYIVAYADHRSLAMSTFAQAGEIPGLVAARWCIDQQRVVLAGHSDGATTAAAVAFLQTSRIAPAVLVLSAAGLRAEDLLRYPCPPAVSVLTVHSRVDALFPLPAFGKGPARWWAACNRCGSEMPVANAPGCSEYASCASGTVMRYCEVDTPHAQFPPIESLMLRFLQDASRARRD